MVRKSWVPACDVRACFLQIAAFAFKRGLNDDTSVQTAIIQVKSRDMCRACALRKSERNERLLAREERISLARAALSDGTGSRYITSSEIFHDLFALSASATKDECAAPEAIIQNDVARRFSIPVVQVPHALFDRGRGRRCTRFGSCASCGTRCHKWPETTWKLEAKVTRAQISIPPSWRRVPHTYALLSFSQYLYLRLSLIRHCEWR